MMFAVGKKFWFELKTVPSVGRLICEGCGSTPVPPAATCGSVIAMMFFSCFSNGYFKNRIIITNSQSYHCSSIVFDGGTLLTDYLKCSHIIRLSCVHTRQKLRRWRRN